MTSICQIKAAYSELFTIFWVMLTPQYQDVIIRVVFYRIEFTRQASNYINKFKINFLSEGSLVVLILSFKNGALLHHIKKWNTF